MSPGATEQDFFAGLDKFEEVSRKAVEEAIGAAVVQALDLAVNEAPRIPHDEGTLQGSGSVFVGRKHIKNSPNVGGNPTPARTYRPNEDSAEVVGTVGFNTPYAAYQHEGKRADGTHVVDPDNYTRQDGRGPKFLETVLAENNSLLMKLAARRLKKHMEGGV